MKKAKIKPGRVKRQTQLTKVKAIRGIAMGLVYRGSDVAIIANDLATLARVAPRLGITSIARDSCKRVIMLKDDDFPGNKNG